MRVDWVVSTSTGHPKIIDLLPAGTRVRLTRSSDFNSYRSRHQYNIDAFLDGLRQMVARSRQ
jgi:phospholipid transport system substrate-binding protein